jgi:type I restriction enzyme S subunit
MSFARYESYKDSGIEWLGEVPEHWEIEPLKYNTYAKGRIGWQNLRSDEFIEEGPYLVTGMHFKDGGIDWNSCYHISGERYEIAPEIQLQRGDVLITKDGTIGKLAFIDYLPDKATLNSHLLVLRPLKNRYSPRFLFHALSSSSFSVYTQLNQSGTTFFGITQESVVNFPLVLPTAKEQQTIATFLDRETAKIDALIAEQQRLIELLKEKRQAVISHAVTKGLNPDTPMKDSGIEWLGEVPEHWVSHLKLNDLALPKRNSFVNGPFGSDLLTSELIQEGVPVIYIRDLKATGYTRISEWCVTEEKAKQLNFCNVFPGDILIAKVGDPPGLAVLYPAGEPDGVITQDVIRIRVNEAMVDQCFLIFLLNSNYGRALIDNISVESTRTRVSLGEYKQLRMVVPPKEEQIAIVTFLYDETIKLDTLTTEAKRGIELLQERRTALISAAVTGKIDVRGLVSTALPEEAAA